MAQVILPIIACALLVGLLWAEKTGGYALILLFKAPLSSLFVLTATLRPHFFKRYYHVVVAGLILGLVGDICLALPGNIPFRAGLAAFLVGHVLYIFAFTGTSRKAEALCEIN